MATEDWRWQGGGPANENMKGVAAGGNGTIVAVGRTDGDFFPFVSLGGFDFLAVKLGPDGVYSWHWQDGTSDEDNLNDAVVNSDGSVVLAGSTEGDWGGTNAGLGDFAAVKLDESGAVLWKWQSGTSDDELLVGITSANSASGSEVVLVGRTEGSWAASNAGGYDFCAAKLDADGNELWSWQDGTDADDTTKAVAVDGDGSVFLAGNTEGDWNQPNEGETDFAVTKLEANGTLAWRWQDGTEDEEFGLMVVVGRDGGVYLTGYSTGAFGGINEGSEGFVVIKIDGRDGSELWRWQDGTSVADKLFGAAILDDDSVIVTGYSEGDWAETNAGGSDFCAARLDANGSEMWRWQAGTDSSDWITAATVSQAVSGAPRAILAGTTEGSWDGDNNGEEDFVLVSLDVGEVDPIPTPAPSQSPLPVPSTPAPSQSPLSVPSTPAPQLTIRAPPETTTAPFTRAPFVLLPPEEGLPTTTTPTPSSAGSGPLQGQTLAPTSPPQGSDPDLASVVGVVAMVVVGVAFFAGCVGCVLGCVTGKDKKKKKENDDHDDGGGGGGGGGGRSSGGGERSSGGGSKSSPSFLARCRRNRYVFMCTKLGLSVMALASPVDVGLDLYVISGYWMDSHPLWATLLVALFVLSCRFTVAFAALHPPPDKNVILPLYVFPFGTASYHNLADEPESTARAARATKQDGEEAEKCLGSFLPIWLRSLFAGWLKAAENEDNWCAWFLILLKFELILVLFCWWAIVLIVGATWVVICQNIGLFMKALGGASEQSLKEEEEKLSQRQSYMNSIKFVEAALESVPQLSFQTYVFFWFGGDPVRFTLSALIAIGSILVALYTYLTTSEKMKAALNMLRAIFRPDAAPAAAVAPAAAPAAVPPPPPPPLFSTRQ
ncbi:unnamed protein product [Ectocarpus sp. 12 AP-2014]